MKLRYDQTTDSLYIDLVDRPSVESRELADGLVADFDAQGRIVGLDIEHASTRLDLSTLEADHVPSRTVRVA
ncbi:MAG: DUF2283 domain-containing protein [Phycisphaerales bacterium]